MALIPALHFADIGVYIATLNALGENATKFEDKIVAAVEQLDSDYDRVSILPSFISNATAARNAITSGETNIVSAASTYHTSILTDELPSSATTVSGVITDLFAAMVTAGETFMSSATGGQFATFYETRYSRTDVPDAPSGSHTVDDSLAD